MSQQEFITGKCSQCGEELRIPAQLASFSCLYCGARMTPADLVQDLEPLPTGDVDKLMERVRRDIITCVTDWTRLRDEMRRNRYALAFDNYEQGCYPIFDDLDLACQVAPNRRDELLQQAIDALLDELDKRWAGNKRSNRAILIEEDKMIVAIFLVPMVKHRSLSISDAFCDLLQKTWVQRYPKHPFYVGTYEAIEEGFRKRIKFCFITTAVCESQGKPDDCAELTAFRAFRDGYLMDCPDGPDLVEEYYRTAPQIVAAIDGCPDRAARYEAIRRDYLQPCYEDLLAGREGQCKERYVQMVRTLQKEYLS